MNELINSIATLIGYLLGLGIIVGLFKLFFKLLEWGLGTSDKKNTTPPEEKEIDTENGEAEATEEYPYIKPYLLTKKEWAFYKALKPITDKYHLHILAKVQLADLVRLRKG